MKNVASAKSSGLYQVFGRCVTDCHSLTHLPSLRAVFSVDDLVAASCPQLKRKPDGACECWCVHGVDCCEQVLTDIQ